jgi:hypothetical protein
MIVLLANHTNGETIELQGGVVLLEWLLGWSNDDLHDH